MNSFEPFVNTELINRIRTIREKTFDPDIHVDEDNLEEARHLSELYRVASNYEPNEFAVVIVAALEKDQDIVYKTLSEYTASLRKRKGKKDETD